MEWQHESKEGGYAVAVDKVNATLDEETVSLANTSGDEYSGDADTPTEEGSYDVTITATDDAGNEATLTLADAVVVSDWITPKTNWTENDRFNIIDYNRIKNNLNYLADKVNELCTPIEIGDMGDDLTSVAERWKVAIFNLFETNLKLIAEKSYGEDYGEYQTFYENGVFIDYEELNRIESATLEIYEKLERQSLGIKRLSFTLGQFKGVRI